MSKFVGLTCKNQIAQIMSRLTCKNKLTLTPPTIQNKASFKDTNHQIFLRSDLQIFVSAMYHFFLNSKTLE